MKDLTLKFGMLYQFRGLIPYYKEVSRVYNGKKTMITIECACGFQKTLDNYAFKLRGFKFRGCKKKV